MSNTITIELCAEDRARLDRILDALTPVALPVALNACTALPEAPLPEILQPGQPVPEAPAPVPAAESTKEETSAVTLDDIRALVQKLIAPGSNKREQAKAVVRQYAQKVSDIPGDKCAECYAALTKLEGA